MDFRPIPATKNEVHYEDSTDVDVLEWLQEWAEELEIPVEELALLLHTQEIYLFENIQDLLGIESLE